MHGNTDSSVPQNGTTTPNQEAVMHGNTDSSVSQNGTTRPTQEAVMTRNKEGSSSQPAEPTDSAEASSSTNDKAQGAKYSLKNQVKARDDAKAKTRGNTDPTIVSDRAGVDVAFTAAEAAGGDLALKSATVDQASTAWEAVRPATESILDQVVALLKLSRAGRTLYKACKARDKLDTAQNLVDRLQGGSLGLPSEVVAGLRAQVSIAAPLGAALADALDEQERAAEAFMITRVRLDGAINLLENSYERWGLAQKAATGVIPPHRRIKRSPKKKDEEDQDEGDKD